MTSCKKCPEDIAGVLRKYVEKHGIELQNSEDVLEFLLKLQSE